ncbi:MAG TPA: Trm112 family protein [Terracidiphilus sp.]|nr:Trm112 family protein [Terracidiphilus sp.]
MMAKSPDARSEIDARVLSLLACPVCHGELRQGAERLVCSACGRGYPIVDGIPVLTPQN